MAVVGDAVCEFRVCEEACEVWRTGLEEEEGDAGDAQLPSVAWSVVARRQECETTVLTSRMSTNATGRDGL